MVTKMVMAQDLRAQAIEAFKRNEPDTNRVTDESAVECLPLNEAHDYRYEQWLKEAELTHKCFIISQRNIRKAREHRGVLMRMLRDGDDLTEALLLACRVIGEMCDDGIYEKVAVKYLKGGDNDDGCE